MLAILQQYDDALSILLLKFQRIGFCKTTFNIKRSTITKPIKHTNYRHGMLLFLNPLINMICNKLLNSSKYNCDYNNEQLSQRF